MSKSHRLGNQGEAMARSFLEMCGYTCLDQQYRKQTGEIDLIVRRGDTIVFVEVKTRGPRALAPPEDWVDAKKQSRMVATSRHWMYDNDLKGVCEFRFDVVGIEFFGLDQGMKINHLAGII